MVFAVSISVFDGSRFSFLNLSLFSFRLVLLLVSASVQSSTLPSLIVEVLMRRERRDDCQRFFSGNRLRDVGVTIPPTPPAPPVTVADCEVGGAPAKDRSCA